MATARNRGEKNQVAQLRAIRYNTASSQSQGWSYRMGFGNLMGALESMAGGSGNLEQAFSQVAANAGQGGMAGALSHAFQSDQTPPFGQMVGSLFGNSNPDQKAGL